MPLTLVDSHAHLDMEEFDKDRDEVIKRALKEGIRAILCPAELTSAKSIKIILDLIKKYGNIIAAAGVHPHQTKHFNLNFAKKI